MSRSLNLQKKLHGFRVKRIQNDLVALRNNVQHCKEQQEHLQNRLILERETARSASSYGSVFDSWLKIYEQEMALIRQNQEQLAQRIQTCEENLLQAWREEKKIDHLLQKYQKDQERKSKTREQALNDDLSIMRYRR